MAGFGGGGQIRPREGGESVDATKRRGGSVCHRVASAAGSKEEGVGRKGIPPPMRPATMAGRRRSGAATEQGGHVRDFFV